jgi:Outer membrane protein beta-barrel domain
MKKLFLSLIFILLSITSFSQDFNGGPILGFVVSQVDGDSLGGYNRIGPSLGVYISREISDKFDFKAELKYVQKGSKSKGDLEENDDYLEIRLQYIEMPFVMHYKYAQRVSFEAGLALGYLFKSEEDHSGFGFVDTRDNYFKTETSILGGVQYQLTDRLAINARANYSIIRISNYTFGGRLWMKRGRFNNVLSFTINYLL